MLASRRARIGLVATAAALLVGFGLPTAAQAADVPSYCWSGRRRSRSGRSV